MNGTLRIGSVALLFLALAAGAACSGGGDDDDDGATPSPSPTPSTVTVTVSAYADAQPVAGAYIVRHAADGSVLATVQTSSSGTLTVDAAPMITAGWIEGNGYILETWVGVESGDSLSFGGRLDRSPAGTLTASWTNGGFPEATRYVVNAGLGCRSNVTAPVAGAPPAMDTVVSLSELCRQADDKFNLLAMAVDSTGQALAFAAVPDLAANATQQIPPWSTAFSSMDVTVSNRDPASPGVSARVTIRAGGSDYDQFNTTAISGTGETVAFRHVPPQAVQADSYRVTAGQGVPIPGGPGRGNGVTKVRPSFLGTETIDLSTALPQFTAFTVNTSNMATPSFAWSSSASLAPADYLLMLVFVAGSEFREWTVFAPSSQSSPFAYPELPEDLAAWRPQFGSGDFVQFYVEAEDYSRLSGYPSAKSDLKALPLTDTSFDERSSSIYFDRDIP